ncbi:MAG: hypothetical protein M8860_08190 [marine benthic group bacterium]|jgi:hypothetical protein|nr:hypothetical protein [Gemmatimonadota bacterium]MCL7962811.1 hypothetical protein [Candidatus Carthagonibacter metallireducens]MCL7965253.1 hypothetical protein [Gemmatimonadota bacterium]MCL7968393.1 hypothetical protein [Gemmatimonadota bacterium]MCL7977423.1 hypothetical protein [Gemmatimonadota bacterium]
MSYKNWNAATVVFAVLLAACGDSTEPVQIPLPEETTEATVADFVTGDILDPSGFDVITRNVVRTDQVTGWDFVYLLDEQLGPALVTRGSYVLDEDEQSGVQVVSVAFDDLLEAPESGYITSEPIPITEGGVFVTRSRDDQAFGSLRCRYFGKFSVDEIDEELGFMTFSHLINPNCESRNLNPATNP